MYIFAILGVQLYKGRLLVKMLDYGQTTSYINMQSRKLTELFVTSFHRKNKCMCICSNWELVERLLGSFITISTEGI